MITLCNILLPNDGGHATSADIRKIFKPTPKIDRVTEVEVAAMITIESTDSKVVFRFFVFYISSLIYGFYR